MQRKTNKQNLILKILLISVVLLQLTFVLKSFSLADTGKRMFISVFLNDKPIKTDAPAYQKDNRVYLSIRSLCDAATIDLSWDNKEEKLVLALQEKKIELFTNPLKRNLAIVDNKEIEMETPLEITRDRAMIPVRFVAEHLGFKVDWDGINFDLRMYKSDIVVAQPAIGQRAYTADDLMWLARIVAVETDESSFQNKLAVANVVLNRSKSPEYPSTVYGVIFDTKWCVQFPPAFRKGFLELKPSYDDRIAAKMALEGVNNAGRSLQFNDYPFKGKDITLFKKIGAQYFYE